MEMENDSTPKIGLDDPHFFPPNFHHIPAEKSQSRAVEHDSPWSENFGKTEKTTAKKQAPSGKTEKPKKKKTPKRKRDIFVDVQVGLLKCFIPQIGFLCDLEKAKQTRKRKARRNGDM